MNTQFPARLILLATTVALLSFATRLPAQGLKTPQVEGSYLGVTQLGVVNPQPTNIGLQIAIQDERRFLGTLNYVEQDNLIVAGSISKSGACQIVADSKDAQATIHLDWQLRGGGAATLLGDLALTTGKETESGPVVFLRPYDAPAVEWGAEAGRYPAIFTSAVGGKPIDASFEITAGARGVLQAKIAGWTDPDTEPILPNPPGWTDPDTDPVVVGASSTRGDFVAVGVGSGANQIVTLTGSVTTDGDGLPVSIDGIYFIDHTAGKVLDVGTFRCMWPWRQ